MHQQLALSRDTICLLPTSTTCPWSPGATESGGGILAFSQERALQTRKGSSLLVFCRLSSTHLLSCFMDSLYDPSWPGALGHSGVQRGRGGQLTFVGNAPSTNAHPVHLSIHASIHPPHLLIHPSTHSPMHPHTRAGFHLPILPSTIC